MAYDIKDLLKDSIQNTQKSIGTQKIFVDKDKNNIEDIFESFNPKSTRNILINKSAPSSKNISKRVSAQFSLNMFGFGLANQFSDQQITIPVGFSSKYDQAAQFENEGKYAEAFEIYTELYKEFK